MQEDEGLKRRRGQTWCGGRSGRGDSSAPAQQRASQHDSVSPKMCVVFNIIRGAKRTPSERQERKVAFVKKIFREV